VICFFTKQQKTKKCSTMEKSLGITS